MFGKSQQDPDLELYTVFDSKSGSYDIPAFSLNRHVLTRDVINMLKDPQQAKNKYLTNAEDFAIFKIGEFSKKTGKLESHNPEHIANMHELRMVAQRDQAPGALSPT